MAKTLKEIEKEISKAKKEIEKINKKEEKNGSLSNVDAGTRNSYQKMLNEYLAEKEKILNGGSETTTPKKVTTTPAAPKTVTPAVPKAPASSTPAVKQLSTKESVWKTLKLKLLKLLMK